MFNTINDVKQNKFIANLDKAVSEFGLTGRYIEYRGLIPSDYDGVYFIMGVNANVINGNNIDMIDVLEKMARDTKHQSLMIIPYRLNDCKPFQTHQDVISCAKHVEFAKETCIAYLKRVPDKVHFRVIADGPMYFMNANNPKLHPRIRRVFLNGLEECAKCFEAEIDPQNKRHNKAQRELGEYNAKKRPLLQRIFKKRPANMVDAEELIAKAHMVAMLPPVRLEYEDKLIDALNKRPDIVYYKSEVNGMVLNVPEGMGFGETKDYNDNRYVCFACDSIYSRDVAEMYLKIVCPDAYIKTPEQMIEKYKNLCSVTIPSNEYENFKSLCKKNGVDYCMAKKYALPDNCDLNILVPQSSFDNLDNILSRLAHEVEQNHIYTRQINEISEEIEELIKLNKWTPPKQNIEHINDNSIELANRNLESRLNEIMLIQNAEISKNGNER